MKNDLEVARDFLCCATQFSWLDWCKGSRPFFWRCPDECWVTSRDGRKNYVKDKLPSNSIA